MIPDQYQLQVFLLDAIRDVGPNTALRWLERGWTWLRADDAERLAPHRSAHAVLLSTELACKAMLDRYGTALALADCIAAEQDRPVGAVLAVALERMYETGEQVDES